MLQFDLVPSVNFTYCLLVDDLVIHEHLLNTTFCTQTHEKNLIWEITLKTNICEDKHIISRYNFLHLYTVKAKLVSADELIW